MLLAVIMEYENGTEAWESADGRALMSRILLIEPYDEIRKLMEMTLSHAGHDVLSVADGSIAAEAMKRERFGCVVVGSPVAVDDGGERSMLLEYIETHSAERPCIVVVTTYLESERVLSAARRLDVCAVFAKPFSSPELLAVIEQCAAGRRPARRWYGIPHALVTELEDERPDVSGDERH